MRDEVGRCEEEWNSDKTTWINDENKSLNESSYTKPSSKFEHVPKND
jgi:hypothetical protein